MSPTCIHITSSPHFPANPGEVTTLYSVTYNTNNSTGGVTPATQTAESSSSTYTFATPNQNDLVKSGYSFRGWSTNPDAVYAQYGVAKTLSLTKDNPNITLYAVWVKDGVKLSDISYMDQLTSSGCTATSANTSKQLIDSRDNKNYWVTRLADGNCWMTQNLDYDDPSSTKVTSPSSWTSTDASYRAYYDPGNYYFTNTSSWTACSNNGTGLSACTGSGWATTGDAHYHAGNYYSWMAATNGTGSSATTAGAIASDSICPSGWQLPTSNANVKGSFGASLNTTAATGASLSGAYGLTNNAAGATKLRSTPMYFIPGGYVYSGSLQYAGSQGRYWSSTAYDSTRTYALYFASSSVNPSGNNYRYAGQSVRCLVQGS